MSRRRPFLLLPTRRGWGVLVLAVASWVGWLVVGLREVQMLALLLLVAQPLAVLLLAVGAWRSRPRASVDGVVPTVEVGSEVRVFARVVAHWSVLPVLELVWALDRPGAPAHPVEEVTTTARVGEQTHLRVRARHRGRLRVALVALVATDPLGLARLRVRTSAHVDVLVLPVLLPPGTLPEALSDFGTRGTRAGAGEPGGSLRDYRSGDAPRSIHWKQSARQGHLLVNVPESGGGTSHRLALVTDAAAYALRATNAVPAEQGGWEPGADFERAVSVAATLVSQWCAHEGEVSVTVGVPRGRTVTSHDVGVHLRALAEVPSLAEVLSTGEAASDGEASPGGSTGGGPDGEPSGDPDPLPQGCILVTGRITPALRSAMGMSPSGVVVLTVDIHERRTSALPRGWDVVRSASLTAPAHTAPPVDATRGARAPVEPVGGAGATRTPSGRAGATETTGPTEVTEAAGAVRTTVVPPTGPGEHHG